METKIVEKKVESYLRDLVPDRNDFLSKLESYAHEYHVPIVQPEVGQLIKWYVETLKPKRILEVGTAIGYSATSMAFSMTSGHIDTIELKEEMREIASRTFEAYSGLNVNEVTFNIHPGDAKDVLAELLKSYENKGCEAYDLIFIDAAKGQYNLYLEYALPMLKPGGAIISDNVLYKGMVADQSLMPRRKKTIVKRLKTYLSYISNHPELSTTILPMGDGVAISTKKEKAHE